MTGMAEETDNAAGAGTSGTTGSTGNAEPLELPPGHMEAELPAPQPAKTPVPPQSATPEPSKPAAPVTPAPVVVAPPPKPQELPKEEAQKAVESLIFGGNAIEAAQEEKRSAEESRTAREIGLTARPDREIKKPVAPKLPDSSPRLRTYASDMSEEIRKRGETLSSIVSAERTKRAQTELTPEQTEAEKKRNATLIAGGIALLGFGLLVIIGVILFSLFSKPSAQETRAPAIVTPNSTTALPLSGKQPLSDRLASERTAASLNLGDIEDVVIETDTGPSDAGSILAALKAPDVLARNASAVMVGVHSFNHNQPFIIVEVSAYDLAFQAMLSWEPTLASSLGSFFAPSGVTSAPPLSLQFTDAIFQNQDVRKSSSAWPIVYAFPRKNILVITTNESTLKEILSRLSLR